MSSPATYLSWEHAGVSHEARWQSEAGLPAPTTLQIVDDQLSVRDALARMRAGDYLLWQGDYPNARHFLRALTRRIDREQSAHPGKAPRTPAEAFARHRARQKERVELLARLLVNLTGDYRLPLPRPQEVAEACREVLGPPGVPRVMALRELLALISAHEWRKKGVDLPQIGGRLHPHYGVFSPVRGEYLDLLAQAPLPSPCLRAFDIGTGSGVIAALLAHRGVPHIIATDQDPRALNCARENLTRLGHADRVTVEARDLYPAGQADLIVCNPPWLPAEPSAPVERAVYDPESAMLRGFLAGLRAHLTSTGEGWLILSDLAERLGLRAPGELDGWFADNGLCVAGRLDVRPRHPKARDARDSLHVARAAEITSLWRLRPR